ncbi:MAG: hypothetical protein A2Y53_07900 [Chloroflexi bacterium RBG_16_47_49]|nr:MAG: hypothetical protein A2Y53_07900 [Chloroflexi bacterium RBG_16_47_49]
MNLYVINFLVISLLFLLAKILKSPKCEHSEQIYYDASGDELPGDLSEACFCKCKKCGQVSVIPSGFQSDAHFDHYLQESELGGSQPLRKIKDD